MMRSILLILLLTLLGSAQADAQTATFEFTPNISNPELDAAMEYAGEIWGTYLQSEVTIKVNVFFTPVDLGFLGLAVPNGRKGFSGAPEPEFWYPTSLANSLAGIELNPGEADMDLLLPNVGVVDWYLGLDGNPGNAQYDFVSVFLHEIGHGLGILSLANVEDELGSFGMIGEEQFAPYNPSFPLPDQEGIPGIYDTYLVTGTGAVIITDFMNNSADLEGIFTGNSVFFDGPTSRAANNGEAVRIYAPGSYSFGSSITHINENTYPSSSGNALMTPSIGLGEVEHDPGPIVLGMLSDIGWNPSGSNTQEIDQQLRWYTYPQGSRVAVFIDGIPQQELKVGLYDFMGQLLDIQTLVGTGQQDIKLGQNLVSGAYIVRIISPGQQWTKKVFWTDN
ncbi:MAG: T9SS type A sorting domain-containing protein [Bacteroidota bacterium]